MVSDVGEYFQVMTELLAQQSGLRPLPPPQAKDPEHDLDYLTNFERKFRKEGRPIYRGCYEKVAVASSEGIASDAVSGV